MVKFLTNMMFALMAASPLAATVPNPINSSIESIVKPIELTWDMLFKVILVEKYSSKHKMKINVPEFDYSLQQLNRKEVIIYGYVIPTTIDGNSFVLSKTPFSSCYFCGNGGVETVMTVKYKGKAPRYKIDDYIALKGTFELNSTDINELIYVLNNATHVK